MLISNSDKLRLYHLDSVWMLFPKSFYGPTAAPFCPASHDEEFGILYLWENQPSNEDRIASEVGRLHDEELIFLEMKEPIGSSLLDCIWRLPLPEKTVLWWNPSI